VLSLMKKGEGKIKNKKKKQKKKRQTKKKKEKKKPSSAEGPHSFGVAGKRGKPRAFINSSLSQPGGKL